MVTLSVPASTANLGPGFDCLGCALALHLRCSFEEAEGLDILGCPPAHSGPDNLIYRAWLATAQALGLKTDGLRLRVASDIPFSRGLGSSAAAIVAGVSGAFLMAGHGLDRNGILQHAARIEGHPDNVAAAIHGGLRASLMEGGRFLSIPFPLHEGLRFTALVPDFELSTRKARAVLPTTLPREDALFNLARLPLLLHALQAGDLPLLKLGLQDRLHQDARLALIPDGRKLWQLAEQAGAAVFLSGAGPTLMCLHLQKLDGLSESLPPGWALLPLKADLQGITQE